ASANLGSSASVRWGERHVPVICPDSTWLTEVINKAEDQPETLHGLAIMTNDLGYARGKDWVVPCQRHADGSLSDVVVRHTVAVRMTLDLARYPIVFSDLVAKLAAESPDVPMTVIESMLAELVRQRVLLTDLQPPMTVTDPLGQLTGLDTWTGGAVGPMAVDLRLDCEVSLPPAVVREAEAAASLLVRLAPDRPGWQEYHAAFLDRYGPGGLVGVRELVDVDSGLGYPAGYRGSLNKATPTLHPRDFALAELAQHAALNGCAEVVLDEQTLAKLTIATTGGRQGAPHTELRFSLHAATPAALDGGQFMLSVVSASRHAGTSVGRFLHILEPADRERFAQAYAALPTSTPGALAVQVSCPPLSPRTHHLARVPAVLPVLSIGEHAHPSRLGLDVDDLAVTADAHRFYLMSLSCGCPVEPLILHAVDLRHGVHPLARFLCEISTSRAAPCTPFFWGHAAQRFPFLPRIRSGRTVFSPARWHLTAEDLPRRDAPWGHWAQAFNDLKSNHRIPDLVQLGEDDVRIRLDLTEPAHLALLRGHLHRAGTATLTEGEAEFGWIGGRPHETAFAAPPQTAWRRRSCRDGTRGRRWYDCAWIGLGA
ncbi:MAG: lantibiotic dehydratase family protein, partial [Streptosporangiaceae bacterium]